jgi:two-component sensor histidine kinase
VKNNLQILASLFRLERAYHPENADATVLRAASNRILAMALVHRQLYESASLEQVDLSKYLGTLTDNVVHSYWDKGGLRIDKRLTPCWVPLDTAINVGLMATEVLSNACIHAFPDPGGHELISIDLSLDQDVATVVVSDNGRGMEASHFEPGTHGLAGGGLGLLLVHRLADQMDARLAWRADGGTTVQFSFSCS